MVRPSRLAPFVVIATAAVGCVRTPLDGGWQGTAVCGSDAFPISAIFNETVDGEVEGVVYIEGINILFGEVIAHGDVVGGDRDPDDGSYSFDLQTDTEPLPEFKVDMSFKDDELNELEGDIEQIDDNGATVQTCDLDLERTSDLTD